MIAPLFLATVLTLCPVASADTAESPSEQAIRGNGLLIEDAENQAPGAVQHIQSFRYEQDSIWRYRLTQEWPLASKKHQFSYSIPLEGHSGTGVGDIRLNYRYQWIDNPILAMAPRLSISLPTGNEKELRGAGSVGFEMGIPLSWDINSRWTMNWNLGLSWTPSARAQDDTQSAIFGFTYGSGLSYHLAVTWDLVFEVLGNVGQRAEPASSTSWNHVLLVSPGIRHAFNFSSGLQLVPGLATPVEITSGATRLGILAYLSLEHPVW